MKIKRNHNIQKEKLFDGLEINNNSFVVNGVLLDISEISNNPLKNLNKEHNIPQVDFEKIIEAGNFWKKGKVIENYYSQENLQVYYCFHYSQIYIFALGEFQPGRYVLYIEGAWYF